MSRHSSLYSIILALYPMSPPPVLDRSPDDQRHLLDSDPRVRDLSILWTDYHGEKELGEGGDSLAVVDKHSLVERSPSIHTKEFEPNPLSTRGKPHRSHSTSSTSTSSVYESEPPPSLRQTSGNTALGPGIIHLYKHARPLSLLESLEAEAISTSHPGITDVQAKPRIEHVEHAPSSSSEASSPQRDRTTTSSDQADGADGTLIAILAVPTWMRTVEFRDWLGGWAGCLEGFRMINDESPNKTIVLLKFKEPQEANDYMSIYTGKTFSSEPNQPETCHPIRIHHLIMHRLPPADPPSTTTSRPSTPPVPKVPDRGMTPLLTGIPLDTIHELPTCPICLERMDSAVTGLITTPCSHVSKCRCLSKWGESTCPVCRYANRVAHTVKDSNTRHALAPILRDATTPNGDAIDPISATPFTQCRECRPEQNDPKANWICVICDYVGCSRYQRGHARDHFMRTGHAYSLEIETQRVWDYMEDNYVHRLIRTRADGKLVELPSAASLATTSNPGTSSRRGSTLLLGSSETSHPHSHSRLSSGSTSWSGNFGPSLSDEKKIARLEDLTLEYSYLLSAQLENQRQHYEAELGRAREELYDSRRKAAEGEGWRKRFVVEEEKRKEAERKSEKEVADPARVAALKKAEVATDLARKLQAELSSEQSLTTGLLSRISALESAHHLLTRTHSSCAPSGTLDALASARERLGEEERKNADLEDMIKDLMFSLESRDKIESAGGAERGGGEKAAEDAGFGGDLRIVLPERQDDVCGSMGKGAQVGAAEDVGDAEPGRVGVGEGTKKNKKKKKNK